MAKYKNGDYGGMTDDESATDSNSDDEDTEDFIDDNGKADFNKMIVLNIRIYLTLLLPGLPTNDYSQGGVFRTPKLFTAYLDLFLDLWNHYQPIYSSRGSSVIM